MQRSASGAWRTKAVSITPQFKPANAGAIDRSLR